MRAATLFLAIGLTAHGVIANSWFAGSKAVYNKWHETELERWLSDHSVPYPTPADRKDLENLVEKNWKAYVVEPFSSWNTAELSAYLQAKGHQTQKDAEQTKDSLISQVKTNWYETEENAQQGYGSIKDWILDTWTESQLKAFCDKNGIPVPQPRKRDTLLQKARSSYEAAAKKLGETAAYPGDWLYASWSESDLKSWLDTNGIPAPQPSSRDKLIATVRRNSRLAYLRLQDQAASATASAKASYATLTDIIIDGWSQTQLKEFCDENGIPVPQGTKINELRALVRKNRARILGNDVPGQASKAFGAATSKASNEYAQASEDVSLAAQDAFDSAVGTWSQSRLKAYLDARGIPAPQASTADQLKAIVRKYSHKAASGGTAWTFDDLSYDNLKYYLEKYGNAAAKSAAQKKDATRDDLVSAAQSAYNSASKTGGAEFASATNYISSLSDDLKRQSFNTWTESDLKAYLDSYGIPVPQGSTIEELKAKARAQYTYFKYGTSSPGGTILAQISETARNGWNWVADQLKTGGKIAQNKAAEAEAEAKAKVKNARVEL